MPDILAMVRIYPVNDGAEDVCINTFAFKSAAAPSVASVAPAIADALDQFYNGADVGSQAISSFISPAIRRGTPVALQIDQYDITGLLGGGNHGSPVTTHYYQMGPAGSSTPLPAEVACVLTLRSAQANTVPVETADGSDPDFAPDRPRQRHSGRIYIGPLNAQAITSTTTSEARVTAGLSDAMCDAAVRLQTAGNVNVPAFAWGIWSRKDAIIRNVASVSVDNAFDIQRRRGPRATSSVSRAVL